jgi:thiosulfate reductase cytochrome b subunit
MAETTKQQTGGAPASAPAKRLHPLPVWIMHWVNAAAIIIMITSGLKIYNDSPIIPGLTFGNLITIGGDPDVAFRLHHNFGQSGALQWHFLGMWIVLINGLAYLVYGIASGRLRRMLFPIRPREVIGTIRETLRFHLSHDDITAYNAVQKLLYIGIILVVIIEVMAGLAIWKPVQLSGLALLFHDFQTARLVHFLGMTAIVLFLLVHVSLALLVPKTLLAMVAGGPLVARTRAAAKLAAQPGA